MSLAFYFDVHVPLQIARALRERGVDVLTAQDDNTAEFTDSDLMDRATELNRVLVSQDDDMLREANVRQVSGQEFSGVIYGHGEFPAASSPVRNERGRGEWRATRSR